MANGIFVGLSTVDLVYGVEKFPSANSKAVANRQEVLVGGPAANASVTFAHLGGKSRLVTTVGRHALTAILREELDQYSIQLIDLNPSFDGVPVISSIAVDRNGDRNIISANAGCMPAPPAQIDEPALEDSSILLVDGHYMQACQVWAESAHRRGIHVVLDGGSWKAGTLDLLKSVDSAICSADFLPPNVSKKGDVVNYLKDLGISNIAITAGAEPVRFASGGDTGTIPVPQVNVVDTMGAGDIFHGAFCYYISAGCGFVEALTKATGVAAESCKFHGTREWMKHFNKTQI